MNVPRNRGQVDAPATARDLSKLSAIFNTTFNTTEQRHFMQYIRIVAPIVQEWFAGDLIAFEEWYFDFVEGQQD